MKQLCPHCVHQTKSRMKTNGPIHSTQYGRWRSMCTLWVSYLLPYRDSILAQKCDSIWKLLYEYSIKLQNLDETESCNDKKNRGVAGAENTLPPEDSTNMGGNRIAKKHEALMLWNEAGFSASSLEFGWSHWVAGWPGISVTVSRFFPNQYTLVDQNMICQSTKSATSWWAKTQCM